MTQFCLEAGWTASDFLSEEKALPSSTEEAIAVATDDVHHFLRLSRTEVTMLDDMPLSALDKVWRAHEVAASSAKSFDLELDATILGTELRGGMQLGPKGSTLISLLCAAIDLEHHRCASPLEVASIGGSVQWNNLLNRPLYSCLHAFYRFTKRSDQDEKQPVSASCISDLLLNLTLFGCWEADLSRGWWPFLPASDASSSFGFGFCVARCSPDLSRKVAAFAGPSDHAIRLKLDPWDEAEKNRTARIMRLPISMRQFRPLLAVRAKRDSHSGALEASAVVMGLKRLARCSKPHRARGAFLIDAQAVLGALRKGRSGSSTLRHPVCQASALMLVCNWKLHFAYLPSESNPADWPCRGKQHRLVRKRWSRMQRPTKFDVYLSDRKHVWRALRRQWPDEFSTGPGSCSSGSSSEAGHCASSLSPTVLS